MSPQHFRIFMASPGDVSHERELALRVIDQLQYEPYFRGKITIEPVAWDKDGAGAPILGNISPQDSIARGLPTPSECDIAVIIFWSRMGTLLPATYKKEDGSRYQSGTEWEYENALEGNRKKGSPEILVYKRQEKVWLDPDEPAFQERHQQYNKVKNFFNSFNAADGSIEKGYNSYENPSEFEKNLNYALKSVITRLLETESRSSDEGKTYAIPPTWKGSPFPGLRAFTSDDAPIFFGRERETDALINRVEENRFVAVVGSSGSGKSSLVGAGLIPRLQLVSGNQGWLVVNSTPDYLGSNDPFAALTAALLRDLKGINSTGLANRLKENSSALIEICENQLSNQTTNVKLLIFIDQFEELFTTVNPSFREAFIELLVNTTECENIRIVVTLRGDFYGWCIEFPKLAKLLEDGTYPLSIPSPIALHEMITRPASRADLDFETGLPEKILEDTGNDSGSLALMAYSLDELFRLRGGGKRLTHEAYKILGGVKGAIGKRSESLFTQLNDKEQKTLSHVFRELVEVDERGTATRQRSPMRRVAKSENALKLVEALTKGRLLVQNSGDNNEPYVEVAHEALLTNWERLAEWIKDTQDDLRLLRQVRIAAQEWNRNDRRNDFLWSQERLEPVYLMRDRLQVDFDSPLKEFVRPEVERLFEEFRKNETYFNQKTVIQRLAEIGSPALSTLVAALPFAVTKSAKKDIYSTLVRVGEEVTLHLLNACQSHDKRARIYSIDLLGKIKTIDSHPVFIELLGDPDRDVRKYAIKAVYSCNPKERISMLESSLSDGDELIRTVAFLALTCCDRSKVFSLSERVLSSPFKDLRQKAVRMLNVMTQHHSLYRLWDLAEELDVSDYWEDQSYYKDFFSIIARWSGSDQIRELKKYDALFEGLCQILTESDIEMLKLGVRLLGLTKNPKAIPYLSVVRRRTPEISELITSTIFLLQKYK